MINVRRKEKEKERRDRKGQPERKHDLSRRNQADPSSQLLAPKIGNKATPIHTRHHTSHYSSVAQPIFTLPSLTTAINTLFLLTQPQKPSLPYPPEPITANSAHPSRRPLPFSWETLFTKREKFASMVCCGFLATAQPHAHTHHHFSPLFSLSLRG